MSEALEQESVHFIEQIIQDDIASGKHDGRIHTRFPPEPNGYLHIGHAMAIWLSFSMAEKYGGVTNLRFDDTNPTTEDTEYVNAIKRDIKWLGYDWEDRLFFSSDHFQTLYDFAVQLIEKGLAYVDDSTPEEIAEAKGDPQTPGTPTPYRDRSVEENLQLFREMKEGKYPDGTRVLRAKIDLASPNMLLRDPLMYRIKREPHHRTGDTWNIYPMYDFAHGQCDSIEEITHSLCSLEFENHRPLYDWFIEKLEIFPSRQIEFARLNLDYTVMSKRRLLRLVQEGYVQGWDDPRMPTLSGMRRRGYTPEAIINFVERSGLTKRNKINDISLLEFSVREHLNQVADRVMVVMDPVKVIISNYPEGQKESLPAINNPEDETAGSHELPFGREIYIERSDFMMDPPKKYFRLAPGKDVRLKFAYIIHCDDVVTDDSGHVQEIHCSYYPDSKSGSDSSGVKPKGTLHWVHAQDHVPVELRMYDRLFQVREPLADDAVDFVEHINPESMSVHQGARAEPYLADATAEKRYQFFRKGYFIQDPDSRPDHLIFNRTVTMRDSWAKKNG